MLTFVLQLSESQVKVMTRYEQEILDTKTIRVVCESGLVPQIL